ncbi:Histidine phosphatase superfamily, clade-2 [Corchorus capsularis]|uniref:Multiple inositol polyphosphate phosphatase 1 n=1 Tax=Corchorus capsularis TaxID=210143 RepID=A0A1R3KHX8_COCAP|nr:Histidine phosphatase superfamily, clade-2 [Corchorus capsularis]
MGLFSGKGNLGPGRHRAFAVTSENRASDLILRFFECCQTYKDFRKSQGPALDKLKEPILSEITSALVKRYELNFTRQDMSSLWFLCKQESSLLDITDQACSLFSPSEVALLEWTDDLEVFIVKGYGKSLNYRMGVPLLRDVVQSMEQAIKAKEDNQALGSYEKARLRFAHAETVVPFSCLLGLFLEGSDFQRIQKEEPLDFPPKPPKKRNWRGSTVAPFAGNNMLVLYSCPANSSSNYFVQVLHNEHPIPMPGCDGSDFCPFEVFKEKIVHPHLKHDYNTLCNVNLDQPKQKPQPSKLSQLFRWLFWPGTDDTPSHRVDL